jgi:hypothetical protein
MEPRSLNVDELVGSFRLTELRVSTVTNTSDPFRAVTSFTPLAIPDLNDKPLPVSDKSAIGVLEQYVQSGTKKPISVY